MQEIKLSEKFVPSVLDNRKVSTIRRGIKQYSLGQSFIVSNEIKILVEVTDIRYCKVFELTDNDAQLDGFKDLKELKQVLLDIYPDLKTTDDVTIIYFTLIED